MLYLNEVDQAINEWAMTNEVDFYFDDETTDDVVFLEAGEAEWNPIH